MEAVWRRFDGCDAQVYLFDHLSPGIPAVILPTQRPIKPREPQSILAKPIGMTTFISYRFPIRMAA
jgi:hypothetical protein